LPFEKLRFSNPQEEQASAILEKQEVKFNAVAIIGRGIELKGAVKGACKTFNPQMVIDANEKLTKGYCDCSYYVGNKLQKGPCEHMLAVRQAYNKTRLLE
jgi:predicted RNA methylase